MSYFETTANMVRDGKDMSQRQIAVLHACGNHRPATHRTVRAIAAELKISKPAITRAIDALVEGGLATRVRDANDGRSVICGLTRAGTALSDKINAGWPVPAKKKAA